MRTRKFFGYSLIAVMLILSFIACEQPTDPGTSTPVAVTGVTLDKAALEMTVGGNAVLTATVAPANATDKTVTWDSDTKGVATVANGAVTAVSAGTAKITVTTNDGGKTAECTVTVKPIPDSIAVTKQPDKTKYGIGDTLDITGLEVTATYSDNTTGKVTVTATDITGFNSATAGSKTLTVTYGGKTATFTVTVVEISSIAITKQPDKTTYGIGETLDITGLVVTATYSDNTTGAATITVANIAGFNSATAGTKTLTVTYSGKTATFTVTVIDPNAGTPGLAYELITSGTNANTYRVSAGTVTEGAVVIPATYEGLPVTEVGSFSNTSITGVTIPEGVTSIGWRAFYNCTGLTSITIPASVTSIDEQAFSNCTSITEITIPASVTSVGYRAFNNWTNSQTIYVVGYSNGDAARAVWVNNWDNYCAAVIVYGVVTEIEITQQPTMPFYIIGEQLDITGLVVTATYGDGYTETVTVTAANVTGFDSATAGTKTLTVTYREKTATFTVTVIELATGDILVTNTNEWNAAKTTISTGGNNQSYTVYVRGSVDVAGSTANTFGSVTGLTVTLKGSGVLYPSSNGNLLHIGANQTLIIDSVGLTLGGRINNNNSLVYITNNARLELKNGKISDNTNYYEATYNNQYSQGGGVYVGSGGSFTMSGGTISGNIASIRWFGSSTSGNTYAHGGGVYNAGTFTMTGGTISGNRAYALGSSIIRCYAYGGGLYNAGTFRIASGTVYGTGEGDLSNTVDEVNYGTSTGAALYNDGTAQRGTFNGETWVSAGNLGTNNNTIEVVNGELQ